jgi:hypothetical protein
VTRTRSRSRRADAGVLSGDEAVQASSPERSLMSDKSPRKNMSKKSGKSIKEKRAEKRGTGVEETLSQKIHSKKK